MYGCICKVIPFNINMVISIFQYYYSDIFELLEYQVFRVLQKFIYFIWYVLWQFKRTYIISKNYLEQCDHSYKKKLGRSVNDQENEILTYLSMKVKRTIQRRRINTRKRTKKREPFRLLYFYPILRMFHKVEKSQKFCSTSINIKIQFEIED